MEKRIITTDVTEEDFSLEGNLRPQTLDDYIGQEKTKSTLMIPLYKRSAGVFGFITDFPLSHTGMHIIRH